MALELFGVTPESVHAHHFSQAGAFTTTSKPKRTTVLEMLDGAAAELAGKLRAQGLTPASLTLASYPEAYAWCSETLRLSSAIRILPAMTGMDPEIVRAWKRELKDRYEALATHGHRALGDAPAPSVNGSGAVTHISYYDLDTGSDDDASDAVPRIRSGDLM